VGIRLRFLGLALFFLLFGAQALIGGLLAEDSGRIIIGLVSLGFSALWVYAQGGIHPTFPAD
jgi:hypothetical protein